MKSSISRATALVASAVLSIFGTANVGWARPSIKEAVSGQAVHIYYDLATNTQSFIAPAPSGTNVFENTFTSPAYGLSSTDPNGGTMGDVAVAAAGGLFHESDFTVYNGADSTSPVTAATMKISFYAQNVPQIAPGQPNSPLLATFNLNLVWPTGLDAGFYSIVTILNMDSLGLNVTSNKNMLEIQQPISHIGGSRLGMISFDSPTLGSSYIPMWWQDNTHPGGYYLIDNPQTVANPGYRWNVAGGSTPEPASMAIFGVAGLTALALRRR